MDIILPVFNGLEDLKKCIESLLKATNKLNWHLHIINDASTSAAMVPFLAGLAKEPRISIYHNEENQGFIKTVNKGFQLTNHDVILLNSDTVVYDGWLDRLEAHANRQDKVATITPLSNNATIASFPEFCSEENTSLGLEPKELDKLCYQVNRGVALKVPTGVGFCMYISREALNSVGNFNDKDFGRGYGEENDFCFRAAAKGFVNLLACDVYVSHTGGVSFGAEKQTLVQTALKKLNEIHPGYDRKIHEFISLDPVREYRLKALFKLSRETTRPTILHICHHFGGGTLQHIRELGEHFDSESLNWVLRAMDGDIVRLEWATAPSNFIDIDTEKDKVFFWEILKYIGIGRLHVHHVAGLPGEVFTFIREAGLDYDVTLHDYHFINANPTLTDTSGNVVSPLVANDLEVWQKEQYAFLQRAKRVLYPSNVSRQIYGTYYPKLNYCLAPHLDSIHSFPFPDVKRAPANKMTKVLVMGALNAEKGADVLESVAKDLSKSGKFEFGLLGYAYRQLHKSVKVLGPYDAKDAEKLIEQENPDFIWFPALWAETYSYTLSAALRSGRPILAPDLGAFPERMLNRPMSKTYDSLQNIQSIVKIVEDFAEEVLASPETVQWSEQPEPNDFYEQSYLSVRFCKLEPVLSETELIEGLAYRLKLRLSQKEKILGLLLVLKRYAIVRYLLKRLPLKQKLRVVQFFTKKNLLDLERQLAS